MVFSRNGRSKRSSEEDHRSDPDPESVSEGADMSEQSNAEAELGLAKSDGYDLVGLQVAEILRKTDSAAGVVRSEAENYAAKVRAETDTLRSDAAEELAEAKRLRDRAKLKLEQSEHRLANTEAMLESAKAQVEELLASARRERDTIIEETVREARDQLTRATRHLQSRVKDVQRSQNQAGELLTTALTMLEALDDDLGVLDPDSVVDLTRGEPTVGPAPEQSESKAAGSEPEPTADTERGAPDSDATELHGSVDAKPVTTPTATAGTGQANTTDAAWIGDVVRTAVSRAMDEHDAEDDPELQRS